MTNLPTRAGDNPFPNTISENIWNMKYRHMDPEVKGAEGEVMTRGIHDVTVQDTWRRIAKSLSAVEKKSIQSDIEALFYSALEDFKFLPAGRIIAGAGTGRAVTLFNCFVMGTIPDDMAGIFDMIKEAALTMQQGGGIGYDFSTIRPSGARVVGVGSDASGPLSFMDVWDSMCRTIMSAGSRRGAMMAVMRCDHPDVEKFIEAKHDAAKLRMFNLSVTITDDFMAAVRDDKDWHLTWKGDVWKTLRARDLWKKIMRSTFDYAEPGVIFIDRINNMNPLKYCETIAATNPCGEQALPPYGACLLGSINLARLILNPFSDRASMDEDEMVRLVSQAVRMMDNVVDSSNFPLKEQEAEAKAKRRIGLGVTGLADALLMLKMRYGSDEAAAQTEAWMKKITHAAYAASVQLAKEKGAFPLFDAKKYLASPFLKQFDPALRADIRKHGIRNALLTSIAPTGTISLYAGNVSSGIEPVFAYSYTRKVLQKDGSRTEEEVVDYAVQMYRDMFGVTNDAELPDYFVSAQTLTPGDHVKMQAAAQKWIDNCISKTINCPVDISFDEFQQVYIDAWDSGCKGCTTYRPNDVTGSVLSVDTGKKAEVTSDDVVNQILPIPRTEALEGSTYKLKWPGMTHAFYITINDIVDAQGVRRPFEVFINTKNVQAQAWISALTLMISAVFRRGGDVSFVAEELRGVYDATGGHFLKGRYCHSLVAAIGDALMGHMEKIGFLVPLAKPDVIIAEPALKAAPVSVAPGDVPILGPQREGCPDYGNCDLISQSGCVQCNACGWSKCS